MKNEQNTAKEPQDGRVSPMRRFFAALENFWYHHKFGTVVTLFLVVVLLICGLQMCSKNTYDVHILYAGPWFDCAASSKVAAIEDAFRHCMQDYNNDGQKVVSYRPIFLMTDQQIQDLKEKYKDNPEEAPYVNTTLLAQNKELLDSELMTGETVICLLDPSIFYDLYRNGWTEDLSSFVPAENLPENPYENHGVFLKDTAFGQYFAGISDMPEDTVLCFRKTSILTDAWLPEADKEAVRENCKDLFRAIVAFKIPTEDESQNSTTPPVNSVPPEKP